MPGAVRVEACQTPRITPKYALQTIGLRNNITSLNDHELPTLIHQPL